MTQALAANVVALPKPDALHCDIAALRRDGFVVLRNLLEPRQVDVLAEELEPWFGVTPRCEGNFYGWKTTRIGGLLSKAPSVQHLAMHWRILAIAEAFLKPSCDCIQLNLTQATRLHAGERAQIPHSDEDMWPADKQGREWVVNVMWAVDDFTAANGGTRVWPGSHRRRVGRDVDPKSGTPVEMPRGSALVYLGSLTHGAGANISSRHRTGVIVAYCAGWLRQYENQYLTYPKEVARLFPEPLQRLIGYQPHRPNLGGWEGRDPIEYLYGRAAPGPHEDVVTPEIAAELSAYYVKAADGA